MVLLSAFVTMLVGGAFGVALVVAKRDIRQVILPSGGAGDGGRVLRSVVREEARTLWLTYRYRLILLLCLCGTAGAVLGSTATSGRPVTAFAYTYPFGATAGPRAWRLDRLDRWHERDPVGRDARLFDVTSRLVVDGCRGSATHESAQPRFEFFVPDMGCHHMALMIRRNGGPWSPLGPMTAMSTDAARDD